MADGTSLDYLKRKVARSHEDLADARELYQRSNYRLSINRAYYAVFHMEQHLHEAGWLEDSNDSEE